MFVAANWCFELSIAAIAVVQKGRSWSGSAMYVPPLLQLVGRGIGGKGPMRG